MSNNNGGPAFPGPEGTGMGMTLRDWFAGQFLTGVGSLPDFYDMSAESVAKMAYQQADAMIAERNAESRED